MRAISDRRSSSAIPVLCVVLPLLLATAGEGNDFIDFESDEWVLSNAEVIEHLGRKCLIGSADLPDIAFDNGIVDLPLPGASQELAQLHDRTAMEYLEKLDRQNVTNRVRGLIVDTLSTGQVSKQLVAEGLNMSTRKLEAKLSEESTNFQQLLDNTRQSLAAGYMEQSGISITEIAYLLGFSDSANFTRAFKRWTGQSPSDFRNSLGLKR